MVSYLSNALTRRDTVAVAAQGRVEILEASNNHLAYLVMVALILKTTKITTLTRRLMATSKKE